MKKSKVEGRVALLEGNNAEASSSLALHNLQASSPVEFEAIEDDGNGAANYMQLRSRRVEKPSPVVAAYEKMQKGCKRCSDSETKGKKSTKKENEDDDEMDVDEDSFGEKIIGGGER